MYFRFASALVLVTLISVAGVAIEKQCLALRRAIARQHYRHDALCDQSARLRLQTQQLGAPARLFEALESGRLAGFVPDGPHDGPHAGSDETPAEDPDQVNGPRRPLLAWQRGPRAEP